MKIGLFFGSFNPIHIGHLAIANLVHETTEMKEIWFIVSPQNPLKKNKNLLHEFDRLDMVSVAIVDDYHFRAIDIEFNLPRPSFTINTLAHLQERYPQHEFHLIIGEDNLESFPKWKNYQEILNQYGLIVYPRPCNFQSDLVNDPNVKLIDAPKMDISATLIRKLIREGKSVKYLVSESVMTMIEARKYYID